MIGYVTEQDMDRSSSWAEKVYLTGDYPGTFDHDHFQKTWRKMIDSDMAILMKRESGGIIHEAIGMIFYKDPFTGEKGAACSIWIVREQPSGLEGGVLFLEMLNELKRRGVTRVCMSVGLNDKFGTTRNTLERFGFKPVEVNFYREI